GKEIVSPPFSYNIGSIADSCCCTGSLIPLQSEMASWRMGCCHTDCIERPLSQCFARLGILIARYPLWLLLISFSVSAGLGVGFYFLPQRETNNIEDQFTPIGGPAKAELDFIKNHFPVNDTGRFSPQQLYTKGSFVSLIAVTLSDNIMNAKTFRELLVLDETVRRLNSTNPDSTTGEYLYFYNLCAEVQGPRCHSSNPLLDVLQGNPEQIEAITVTYPVFQDEISLVNFIGGATLGQENIVEKAIAIRLVYYLRENNRRDKDNSLLWMNHFIKSIPNEIAVSYFASVSIQQEFDATVKSAIPLISIAYFVTIFFSIISNARLDIVRNKLWVATFGVISPGLAIVSSFGLLLFCGVPYVITVANAPFLILGVGVDDMFIIISSWEQTNVKSTVEKRMADTYAAAGVSITITTLTDVLSFYIGIMTSFGSVQSFCIYTGTALLFCFIYNLTCFGAILALNGRREASNRHWLICTKVDRHVVDSEHSALYKACCVGGVYDQDTGREMEHPATGFFHNYYGPFLTNTWTKFVVVILYVGYLASSIYGSFQVQEGTDLRNLASDSSYVVPFYDKYDKYFSEYGPRVMVTVTHEISYWDVGIHGEIETCMESFENNPYVSKTFSTSWLRAYVSIASQFNLNISDQKSFIGNLNKLFLVFPDLQQDVELESNTIKASRFFIQTINLTSSIDEKNMLNQLRGIAKGCEVPLIVYNTAFLYLDQYSVIVQDTVQNILVAAAVMFVVAILLIPNPLCSLWVTFAIASIIVGVTGFMAYWKISLDSVSMINLVICIGFSVDFSAHISYAYVSNKKPTSNDRIVDALHSLGYPILQGSLSTILGVIVLSTSESYIFRTFLKIIFLVIAFGVLHGLLFLPVFLTLFGNFTKKCLAKETNQKVHHGGTIKYPHSIEFSEIRQGETVQ
uniref:Patched domain-containing protein 3 n=1 Tax=Leptobrachium leishanense TaxID=445787 RepID=A0A8C5Q6M2_9ANUR